MRHPSIPRDCTHRPRVLDDRSQVSHERAQMGSNRPNLGHWWPCLVKGSFESSLALVKSSRRAFSWLRIGRVAGTKQVAASENVSTNTTRGSTASCVNGCGQLFGEFVVQESTGEIERRTSIQGQTMLILIQIKLLPDKPDSMILLRRLMITQKERRVKFVWI